MALDSRGEFNADGHSPLIRRNPHSGQSTSAIEIMFLFFKVTQRWVVIKFSHVSTGHLLHGFKRLTTLAYVDFSVSKILSLIMRRRSELTINLFNFYNLHLIKKRPRLCRMNTIVRARTFKNKSVKIIYSQLDCRE